MKKLLFLSLLFSTAAFCLHSCSEDEKAPADANENFVTSVTFTVNNKSYDAVIDKNTITITVPYTLSLDHAAVEFKHTTSAKVLPDPATVTDWDNERVFRVTSYNGEENKYTYRVIKDDIRQEGDVTLKNATEITAFAESGVTVIKGNLIIGTDDGEKIENITALAKLKQVEGTIIIKNSYKGTDLTGLDKVTSIGGLQIGSAAIFSNSPVYQVSLKSLTTMTGNLSVYNNETKWVMTEALTTVGGHVAIHSSALQSIQMDKLSGVAGNLDIQSAMDENGDGKPELGGTMVALSFPELTSVGDTLSTNNLAALKSISLEKLSTAGAIIFNTLPLTFEKINLPAIKTVEGDLNISSNTIFYPIGHLTEGNKVLTSFAGFDKLEKVGGTLTFSYFTEATKVPDVSKIRLGGYYLNHMEKVNPVFDFSKTIFEKKKDKSCEIKLSDTPITKIIGQQTMNCILNLDRIDVTDGIPALENIEVIDELIINTGKDRGTTKELNLIINIKKVINNLEIHNGSGRRVPSFSFPNLEEVKGSFWVLDYWNGNIVSGFTHFSAPKLTIVGGQFMIANGRLGILHSLDNVNLSSLKTVGYASNIQYYNDGTKYLSDAPTFCLTLSHMKGGIVQLEAIEKVGGRGMRIGVYYQDKGITRLSCPKLTTVDGKLTITGAPEPRFADPYLTSFDFPKLTKTESIYIENFKILKDFSAFAPLFTNNTIGEGNWNVSGCAYNPTYQKMKDGIYTKP